MYRDDLGRFAKMPTIKRNHVRNTIIVMSVLGWVWGFFHLLHWAGERDISYRSPIILQSPVVIELENPIEFSIPVPEDENVEKTPVEEAEELTNIKESYEVITSWKGQASYYSIDGCVGCREDRLMANGQRLDDNKLTVAFNKAPLNSKVFITNLDNNVSTVALVTDTGGFEKLGRIVDLNLATKKALACNDLCNVRVEVLE